MVRLRPIPAVTTSTVGIGNSRPTEKLCLWNSWKTLDHLKKFYQISPIATFFERPQSQPIESFLVWQLFQNHWTSWTDAGLFPTKLCLYIYADFRLLSGILSGDVPLIYLQRNDWFLCFMILWMRPRDWLARLYGTTLNTNFDIIGEHHTQVLFWNFCNWLPIETVLEFNVVSPIMNNFTRVNVKLHLPLEGPTTKNINVSL